MKRFTDKDREIFKEYQGALLLFLGLGIFCWTFIILQWMFPKDKAQEDVAEYKPYDVVYLFNEKGDVDWSSPHLVQKKIIHNTGPTYWVCTPEGLENPTVFEGSGCLGVHHSKITN